MNVLYKISHKPSYTLQNILDNSITIEYWQVDAMLYQQLSLKQ